MKSSKYLQNFVSYIKLDLLQLITIESGIESEQKDTWGKKNTATVVEILHKVVNLRDSTVVLACSTSLRIFLFRRVNFAQTFGSDVLLTATHTGTLLEIMPRLDNFMTR